MPTGYRVSGNLAVPVALRQWTRDGGPAPPGAHATTGIGLGTGRRVALNEAVRDRRLLAVSAFPPWPILNGYALRVAHLVAGLAETWRITLVSPPPGDSSDWSDADRLVRWYRVKLPVQGGRLARQPAAQQPLRAAVSRVLHEAAWDAALLWGGAEFLALEATKLPPAVWDRIDSLTLQELRSLSQARTPASLLRHAQSASGWALHERRAVRTTRATTVVGRRDAKMLRRLAPGCADRIHVLPNGVDLRPFADYSLADDRPTIAFTGHLSYAPNVRAARHLISSVWPKIRARIPEARCVIAGRSPTPAVLALSEEAGVEVRRDVPSMPDELVRAWVVVAPMRSGSGIKNKVLEAWAVGRPVVMYPLASNGLSVADSLDELIVDGPEEMAARVIQLLGRRAELEAYASVAHEHARGHTWDRAVEGLSSLLGGSVPGTEEGATRE